MGCVARRVASIGCSEHAPDTHRTSARDLARCVHYCPVTHPHASHTNTDNALVVTDYTEEPKYAAEVNEAEQVAEVEAAGGGGGGGVSNRNEGVGVPLGSGRPQVLSDARHLDAIFAPPSAGMQ